MDNVRDQQVLIGKEAREKLVKGIDILADAVVSTLGPNGRNAVYNTSVDEIFSTKDGVTVAKAIKLGDPVLNAGVELVRQAAVKTADNAGDGTTTATLLARELIKLSLPYLANGENAVKIKRQIDASVEEVIQFLKDKISTDISDDDQLDQIASISANNDIEIGKIIAEAIKKVGNDGIVTLESSKTGETYLESVEGMQYPKGWKSPYFVNDNNTMTAVLDNPLILIVDGKLNTIKELLPVLEKVASQNRSLLVIADDITNEALAAMVVNKVRGTLQVCGVHAPDYGESRKLILDDIAVLTGGEVFSTEKGMKWDRFDSDWFGEARKVTVSKGQTTIIDGKGKVEKIDTRIEELHNMIEKAKLPVIIEKLRERLGNMVNGVSIVHVGGQTEAEAREKKDRAEDALHATKAAVEQGILPGGGCALLHAKEGIETNNIGSKIVYQACLKPFVQILNNAGYSKTEAEIIAQHRIINSDNNFWKGYNLETEEIVDMKDVGILDPTKVTVTALKTAASIAGTILLTETLVLDLPNEEQPNKYKRNGVFPVN